MKSMIEEYGIFIVYSVIGAAVVLMLTTFFILRPAFTDTLIAEREAAVSPSIENSSPPVLEVKTSRRKVAAGTDFDPHSLIKAAEEYTLVEIYNEGKRYEDNPIDTEIVGKKHNLRYVIKGGNGLSSWAEVEIEVVEKR